MGLCGKLNCCSGKKAGKKQPTDGSDKNDPLAKDKNRSNGDLKYAAKDDGDGGGGGNGVVANGKEKKPPVYATVDKKQQSGDVSSSPPPPLPPAMGPLSSPPRKAGFLVSFVVDSRGSAMTGCRGSGIRLIIPPGAVEQPVRVTCRFVRSQGHQAIPPPPPLMERDALASGIVECGPVGTQFKTPVLLEIPHFASLGKGERELVVLRSEDGSGWREHSTSATFADSAWEGEERELYQDVVTSVSLKGVSEDLETGRIIRLSTTSFPKFFAVLSRIKGEVVTIGPEGGKVEAPSVGGQTVVKFPAGCLQKRVKIGLQLQPVPADAVRLLDKTGGVVDAYPLVGVYPRRRKFHAPIEVSVPVISQNRCEEVKKIWLLCSLSGAHERARWEDVSESASVQVRGKKLVFETKVSALFWIITASKDFDPDTMMSMANSLYKELSVSPYIARLTVFHREQFPHAWCDTLRIYLSVNDRLDGYIESREREGGETSPWSKMVDGEEVEVTDRSVYVFDCGDNLSLARDCQMEARLTDQLRFNAFQENSLTLLVRWKREGTGLSPQQGRPLAKKGRLVMKKQIGAPGATVRDVYQVGAWPLDARRGAAAADYEEIDDGSKRESLVRKSMVEDGVYESVAPPKEEQPREDARAKEPEPVKLVEEQDEEVKVREVEEQLMEITQEETSEKRQVVEEVSRESPSEKPLQEQLEELLEKDPSPAKDKSSRRSSTLETVQIISEELEVFGPTSDAKEEVEEDKEEEVEVKEEEEELPGFLTNRDIREAVGHIPTNPM